MKVKKQLALLLCLVMLCSMLSVWALAEDAPDEEVEPVQTEKVQDLEATVPVESGADEPTGLGEAGPAEETQETGLEEEQVAAPMPEEPEKEQADTTAELVEEEELAETEETETEPVEADTGDEEADEADTVASAEEPGKAEPEEETSDIEEEEAFELTPDATSGTCGDNLTWTLDDSGTLTISGTGAMEDYNPNTQNYAPWGTYSENDTIKKVIIRNGVTNIGDQAFRNCVALKSIEISETVTGIGWASFFNCKGMQSIIIPGNVLSIGQHAFNGCSSLASVTILNGVTSIDGYAFYNCSVLTKITIPESVTSMGGGAFVGCEGLASAGPVGSESNIEFGWTDRIPNNAFQETPIIQAEIPGSIETIGERAFYRCRELKTVAIGKGVKSIESFAFEDCYVLSSIDIPGSVSNIEFGVFRGCSALQSVTIQEGVKSIGRYVFYNCSNLEKIIIPGSVESVGDNVFTNCSKLSSAGPIGSGCSIEFGWTSEIPEYAFYQCTELKSLIIPEGITRVRYDACYNCISLSKLKIPSSLTYFEGMAFYNCDQLISAGPVGSGCCIEFDWANSIPNTAFNLWGTNGAKIRSVMIPRNISWIEYQAFSGSPALVDIHFAGKPLINATAFQNVTANAFYPDDGSWTEKDLQDYGGQLDWVAVAPGIVFSDVQDPFSYYYKPVYWAVDNGITSGTSSTTFSPGKDCTRGQIVTFLWKAMGSPEPGSTDNPFTDVKPSDYFYKPVLWAKENGVTAGTSATTFSPGKGCTRGQIVTFLWKAMRSPGPRDTSNPFTDVKPSDYFYNPVLWAKESGVTSGTSATTFSPGKTCTRAQAMTFLYKALN